MYIVQQTIYNIYIHYKHRNPAHSTIFQPKYTTKLANKPTAIPTFGLRVNSILDDIPLIELSDIAEYQEPENPVWTIDQPVIRLDLRVGIKRILTLQTLFNYLTILNVHMKIINLYTLIVQKLRMLLDVNALMGNTSLKEHLPSTFSIYTAELRAILLAFKLINKSSYYEGKFCDLHRLAVISYGHPEFKTRSPLVTGHI